jgi:transcriptional repressor NF-X1
MQPSSRDFFISPSDKDIILPRINCTDPIPTCSSTCNKPLPPSLCSSDIPHTCQMKCHLGPCALPCMNKITVPCRCGSISKTILCSDLALGDNGDGPGTSSMGELLCNKPCPAMRYCGKHTCNRVCCPLASLGKVKGKGKSRKIGAALGSDVDALDLDPGGLHVCDLDCGKLLSCGLHKCEARDHTGSCGPCLRSTFEEVICDCGMTTLEPPVPCGTILQCPYPCTRPPPPCGHPRALHGCHGRARHEQITQEDSEEDPRSGCPPCLFLTERLCACGKKEVPNKPCSVPRDKVLCGTVCGMTLGCGFHKCQKTCHSDGCGLCTAPCGKPRKLW